MALPALSAADVQRGVLRRSVIFPEGLVGCPDWRRFRLLEDPEVPELALLESLDDPAVGLAVARLDALRADFLDALGPADRDALTALGIGADPEVALYCTITFHDGGVTANLVGPIAIDARRGHGSQVVLVTSPWSVRQPVGLLDEIGGSRVGAG